MKRSLAYVTDGKRRRILTLVGFCFVCVILFSLLTPYFDNAETSNADYTPQGKDAKPLFEKDTEVTINGKKVLMPAIPEAKGTKLSASNPFVMVEVVPTLAMQELPYQVKGSEPFDLDYALDKGLGKGEGNNASWLWNNFIAKVYAGDWSSQRSVFFDEPSYSVKMDVYTITAISRYSKTFSDEYQNLMGKNPPAELGGWQVTSSSGGVRKTGYMEKVNDGQGYFKLSGSNFVQLNESNYESQAGFGFIFVETAAKPANLVTAANAKNVGDKVWVDNLSMTNYTFKRGKMTNHDIFVKEIFCIEQKEPGKTFTKSDLTSAELTTFNQYLGQGMTETQALTKIFDALVKEIDDAFATRGKEGYLSDSNNVAKYKRTVRYIDNWEEKYKGFNVKVIAVTPEMLNYSVENADQETMDYIERADLIYFKHKLFNNAVPTYYEAFSPNMKYETLRLTEGNPQSEGIKVNTNSIPNFQRTFTQQSGFTLSKSTSNDITWDAAYKIMQRLGTEPTFPLILHSEGLKDGDSKSGMIKNVHIRRFVNNSCGNHESHTNHTVKLYYMATSMDAKKFYDLYIATNVLKEVTVKETWDDGTKNKVTGYIDQDELGPCVPGHVAKNTPYNENDSNIYWNDYTFWPNVFISNDYGQVKQTLIGEYGFYDHSIDNLSGTQGRMGNVLSYHNGNNIANYLRTYAKHIRDILNLSPENNVNKPSIRVLNIEPSAEQLDTNGEVGSLTKARLSGMLNNFPTSKIEIVTMTTAELIGMQENLMAEYDLIYIGSALDGLNTAQQNGKTVTRYNDASLNGYVYLHVGDVIKNGGGLSENQQPTALIAGGSNQSRLPGNDINQAKLKELLDCVKYNYPIIISDAFYNSSYGLDDTKVDKASNMYAFFAEAMGTPRKSNVFKESELTDAVSVDNLITNVNECRNIINDLQVETPKIYYNEEANAQGTEANYIGSKGTANGLTFKFNVSGSGTYKAKLYIDHGFDGIYKEEPDAEKNVTKTGDTISVSLDRDYFSSIGWKLVVYEDGNAGNVMVKTGTSAVSNFNKEKEVRYVLQVVNEPADATLALGGNVLFGPTLDPYATPVVYNAQALAAGEEISKYLDDTLDYEFVVATITARELEEWYDEVTRTYHIWNADVVKGENKIEVRDDMGKPFSLDDPATDRFAKFDILLIGCQEDYNSPTDETLVDKWEDSGIYANLLYAMNQGKPVIFTNGTTTLVNKVASASDPEIKRGYYTNRWYRTLFGLDRYGVRQALAARLDYGDPDSLEPYVYDAAYRLGDKGDTYAEQQGYSYYGLFKVGHYGAHGNAGAYLPYKTIKDATLKSSKEAETTSVEALYDSIVMRYPYHIMDENSVKDSIAKRNYRVDVAKAHAQAYQINPEDTQVKVYATLDGDSTDRANDKVYASSPHDATNNYYLYQKKNMIYLGIGANGAITQGEAKLFVNTLVLAANLYKNKKEPPLITVRDSVKTVHCMDSIYLDMDYSTGSVSEFKDDDVLVIYFKVDDLAMKDRVETTVVRQGDAGTEEMQIFNVNDMEGDVGLGKEAVSLESDKWYALKYNKKWFEQESQRKLTITAKNLPTSGGMESEKDVLVIERFLFNLD